MLFIFISTMAEIRSSGRHLLYLSGHHSANVVSRSFPYATLHLKEYVLFKTF